MTYCLFCNSIGPFTRVEHVIPEALGNDDLILSQQVCDRCNQYFGAEVENFVLGKTPLAFWRTFLGIRKKHKGLPHVDLSQPKTQKGRFGSMHNLHDNLVGFTCHDDYSVSVDIDNDEIVKDIFGGSRNRFTFVFTPLVLSMMGRFFCKIGVELVCITDPVRARSETFAQARKYARFGKLDWLWPFFHAETGNLKDLRTRTTDSDGPIEEVLCYHYRLVDIGGKYVLLALTIGTDTWVVSLNDPFPTPVIRSAFPNNELSLIWSSPDEMKKTGAQQSD
jgi:hypothetical protein